jgi:very-long-chain enoyl-CoA reductase
VSYAGALVALPAVAGARGAFSGDAERAWSLAVPVGLWVAHFLRRTLEALWLHRYSKPRFPLGDALLEYAYYWGFGAWIAWTLSSSPPAAFGSSPWLGGGLFVLGELGNHRCHRLLATLRRPGENARPIPHGFLFEWVSCPHYFFEITTWVGFALLAPSLPTLSFLALGAIILGVWGWQRHRDYRRRFAGGDGPPYPPRRRAVVPFVF